MRKLLLFLVTFIFVSACADSTGPDTESVVAKLATVSLTDTGQDYNAAMYVGYNVADTSDFFFGQKFLWPSEHMAKRDLILSGREKVNITAFHNFGYYVYSDGVSPSSLRVLSDWGPVENSSVSPVRVDEITEFIFEVRSFQTNGGSEIDWSREMPTRYFVLYGRGSNPSVTLTLPREHTASAIDISVRRKFSCVGDGSLLIRSENGTLMELNDVFRYREILGGSRSTREIKVDCKTYSSSVEARAALSVLEDDR